MSNLQIVQWYTGWSKEIASNAISQWKEHNSDWSADYILVYFCTDIGCSRLNQLCPCNPNCAIIKKFFHYFNGG